MKKNAEALKIGTMNWNSFQHILENFRLGYQPNHENKIKRYRDRILCDESELVTRWRCWYIVDNDVLLDFFKQNFTPTLVDGEIDISLCVCVCLNFDVPSRKWIHWGEEKSWYRQKDDPWKWIPYLYVSIESITGKADFLLQWEGERECHILDLYIKKELNTLYHQPSFNNTGRIKHVFIFLFIVTQCISISCFIYVFINQYYE